MSCFACFKPASAVDDDEEKEEDKPVAPLPASASKKGLGSRRGSLRSSSTRNNPALQARPSNITSCSAHTFTYTQLAAATDNFRADCLLGEGGFGRVYRGRLEDGQVVAVKQLDLNGVQGNHELVVEVLMLSSLHHENLVSLVGYCADGEQRLLVYEYMALGDGGRPGDGGTAAWWAGRGEQDKEEEE